MESSQNQRLDVLQSDFDQKIDILQHSISRLTNHHHVHPEEECLIDTILGKQAQLQQFQEELIEEPVEAFEELQDALEYCVVYGPWRRKEEILPLLTEEGSRKETVEEPQKLILKPLPTKLNPSATAQATNNPLPTAPSPDLVHILPTLAAHSTLETPTPKAIPFALSGQYFRKLVTSVQTFTTTSQTLATAHVAWHSGWLVPKPSWFRFGAPGPQQFHQLHQFQQPPKA